MSPSVGRRIAAESVGTALLVAAIVGSGIMAERLAAGNGALALLANALATGATLVALILVFGPVSGAQFNPVVTFVLRLRGELSTLDCLRIAGAQLGGALVGVIVAHAMFEQELLQVSHTVRAGGGQLLSEFLATFGLVGTIVATRRSQPAAVPFAVGSYIVGAYWFTASTSFANPAVTIARAFTATFAGIARGDVPGFIAAQFLGAILAAVFFEWLAVPRERAVRD